MAKRAPSQTPVKFGTTEITTTVGFIGTDERGKPLAANEPAKDCGCGTAR